MPRAIELAGLPKHQQSIAVLIQKGWVVIPYLRAFKPERMATRMREIGEIVRTSYERKDKWR